MLNSTTLEVAVGMAFIYLLISLICTAIQESIAGLLSLRARNLKVGIQSLFTEGTLPRLDAEGQIARDDAGKPIPGTSLTDAVYNHGLVQSLYPTGAGEGVTNWWGGGQRLPSYIPARTFSAVVMDLLFPDPRTASLEAMLDRLDNLPDSKAKQALTTLVRQANGNLAATRQAVESWFNDGMDRASGWYKRRTQLILFFIGLSLALALNIDSINIGRALWNSPALRSYSVAAAQGYASLHPVAPVADANTSAAESMQQIQNLQSVALPLGWNGSGPMQWLPGKTLPRWSSGGALLFAIAGWLLTAIAMTLGAPFWFDFLNQFMVVRSTIKPSEKSEVEASKDPVPGGSQQQARLSSGALPLAGSLPQPSVPSSVPASVHSPNGFVNAVIDMSENNSDPLDFKQAKAAGLCAVLHKASEGVLHVDRKYQARRTSAQSAGLLWGAYHFGTNMDGATQARFFLSTVGSDPGTLLVFDFEPNEDDTMTLQQARDFVSYVYQKTGRWPGLYSNSFLNQQLGASTCPILSKCWLWLARYGHPPLAPAGLPDFTLWQYTDNASPHIIDPLAGIGHCNRSYFRGTVQDLQAFWSGSQ